MIDNDRKEVADELWLNDEAFTAEIFLSTDGKHTVRVQADTPKGRQQAGKWAISVYEALVKRLGTKADMWDKAMNGKNKTAYVCETCGSPAEFKAGVSKKTGKAWSAIFCTKDKEHVKWLPAKGDNA